MKTFTPEQMTADFVRANMPADALKELVSSLSADSVAAAKEAARAEALAQFEAWLKAEAAKPKPNNVENAVTEERVRVLTLLDSAFEGQLSLVRTAIESGASVLTVLPQLIADARKRSTEGRVELLALLKGTEPKNPLPPDDKAPENAAKEHAKKMLADAAAAGVLRN